MTTAVFECQKINFKITVILLLEMSHCMEITDDTNMQCQHSVLKIKGLRNTSLIFYGFNVYQMFILKDFFFQWGEFKMFHCV
jgi:hypothetical protein